MTTNSVTPGMERVSFLETCGKPLFFRVANSQELALKPPSVRLGESVRTWARAVDGMQKEALVVFSRNGVAWRLASDEGEYLKGADAAPCPLSFLTAGMVSSFMSQALAIAQARSVQVRRVRLTQDNYYTMQGSALKGTMTGGALPVELAAEMDTDASPETNFQIVKDAIDTAPIGDLVRRSLTSVFSLTHNGQPISPGRVSALSGDVLADLGARFDAANADASPGALIAKHGLTPRTGEATSSAGSSLAEEQNRRLHIRGICSIHPDGLFEIEQQLFNPRGSIFRFTADPENLRAPGPASYISAGIAFCFLTQLGRYASIVRKPLESYSLVQDTHFSAPGERSGRMEPVETHVHLGTGEDDAFAKACLDMSEQTCFLHALCRTPLDVHCSVSS